MSTSTISYAAPIDNVIIDRKAEALLSTMTLEEKVGQLFIVRPENISGLPVGGVCVFEKNIQDKLSLINLTNYLKSYGNIPMFISVDEEGGRIARLARKKNLGIVNTPPMLTLGTQGDIAQIQTYGAYIGNYLYEYGFNLDFAPVVDVFSNPANKVIGDRAFSRDASVVGPDAVAFIKGLHSQNIMGCIKHFPGHGDTTTDSHEGMVYVYKTWEELKKLELLPYVDTLNETDMVMVAHINCPNITSVNVPASLSSELITDKLRNELGYQGVVITDSMEMGAIINKYGSAKATVMAVMAGNDIVLLPMNITESYNALLEAVKNGTITEERIDESVVRILKLKFKYNLIM